VGRSEERSGALPPRPTSDAPTNQKAPALRVALSRPVDVVASLARATSPRFTPLLATERLRAITVGQSNVISL
jgi:hypothetical protein